MRIKTFFEIMKISFSSFNYWWLVPIFLITSVCIVKFKKKNVAGFAIFSNRKLHFLAVAEKFRGCGIGSKIMCGLKGKVDYLWVSFKNCRAQKFYSGFGFKPFKVVWFFGRHLKMVKGHG